MSNRDSSHHDAALRLTAIHEAGHAVVALVLGRPVQKVSIKPDDERLGHCELSKAGRRPSEDWLEAQMLILLAGVAAEARATGRYNWRGAEQDLLLLRRLSLMRGGREKAADRLERRALARVEHMLDDSAHWLAVTLIADELMERTSIPGRAARHFFDQAQRQMRDR